MKPISAVRSQIAVLLCIVLATQSCAWRLRELDVIESGEDLPARIIATGCCIPATPSSREGRTADG